MAFQQEFDSTNIWDTDNAVKARNTICRSFLDTDQCPRIQNRFTVFAITGLRKFSAVFTAMENETRHYLAIKAQAAITGFRGAHPMVEFNDRAANADRTTLREVLAMLQLKGEGSFSQVDFVHLTPPMLRRWCACMELMFRPMARSPHSPTITTAVLCPGVLATKPTC